MVSQDTLLFTPMILKCVWFDYLKNKEKSKRIAPPPPLFSIILFHFVSICASHNLLLHVDRHVEDVHYSLVHAYVFALRTLNYKVIFY